MSFDITISTHSGESVGAWRTDAPIVSSKGYGGHPISARPKKKALTIWEGRQPFEMSVPLLLDTSEGVSSVQHSWALLDRWATSQTIAGGRDRPPPPVRILSSRGRLPIPADIADNADWWIEDLAWGLEKRRSDGELFYQEVVVTLLERVDDELLASSTPVVSTKRAHNYPIRKGDTWHSIAASQLGSASKWEELWKLNGKKSDAWLAKNVGKVVHIPAKK